MRKQAYWGALEKKDNGRLSFNDLIRALETWRTTDAQFALLRRAFT